MKGCLVYNMIKLGQLLAESSNRPIKVGDFVLTTGRGAMTGPNSPVAISNLLARVVGIKGGKYLIKFRGSNNPLEATGDQILKTNNSMDTF